MTKKTKWQVKMMRRTAYSLAAAGALTAILPLHTLAAVNDVITSNIYTEDGQTYSNSVGSMDFTGDDYGIVAFDYVGTGKGTRVDLTVEGSLKINAGTYHSGILASIGTTRHDDAVVTDQTPTIVIKAGDVDVISQSQAAVSAQEGIVRITADNVTLATNYIANSDKMTDAYSVLYARNISANDEVGRIDINAKNITLNTAENTLTSNNYGNAISGNGGGKINLDASGVITIKGGIEGYNSYLQQGTASLKVNINQNGGTSVVLLEGPELNAADKSEININGAAGSVIKAQLLASANQSLVGGSIAVDFSDGGLVDGKITAQNEGHIDIKGADIKGAVEADNKGTVSILAQNGNIIESNVKAAAQGTVDLDLNNSVFKGQANADNATLDLKLQNNSVWMVTGDSNLTTLVNDNSTVDMTGSGSSFNTLKLKNLSGGNGLIKMKIDASRNTANSDKLYITGSLNGTQYVEFYEVNGRPALGKEGLGTVLASVRDNSGTLAAKDSEGTLYWKHYVLDHQATADTSGAYTRDWYLKQIQNINAATTSVTGILSANALNYHTWRTENDKLMQRMGELRHNGEANKGAWFRLKGSKIGRDGNFGFENKYKTYELGYDAVTSKTENMTRYQGVAFSYTDGDSSYSSGNGDNSSKAVSFYTTQQNSSGHYLDVVLKVGSMDNDFTVYDSKNKKITGDFKNTGVSLSAEYGRKNSLAKGWYVEPQAQFTLGYLGGDDYVTNNGINIDQSGIKSAVGRLGFNIGREIGSKGTVYAKANLLHEFGGGYDVTMNDGTDRLQVSDTFNDTWFEYGIGAAFATGPDSQFYLDVERSSGSDFKKDWQWNVGARWSF
ncbi:autotransporter family protein [Phascolarctobacterium sp.]